MSAGGGLPGDGSAQRPGPDRQDRTDRTDPQDPQDRRDWRDLAGQAVESVGTSLDEQATCAELALFLCRQLCEAAAVDLLPEPVTTSHTRAGTRSAAGLDRVAAVGRTGLLEAAVPQDGPGLSVRAVDDGHPITVSTAAGQPGREAVHEAVHAVSVPLVGRGRLYGAVLAVRTDTPPDGGGEGGPGGGAFTDEETAVVHFAGRLAAVHLRHAREHSATHSTALNLQQALLAEPGRPHPNLDLATRYLPSGTGVLVGGDWFETVRLHYGRTLLVIGDVMGHGLDAAVDMNAYRSMLRYVASTDLPPHRVLRQLDAAVSEEGTRRPATCLLVRIDPARGSAAFSSAGHLPPALFGPDGTGTLIDVPVGPPLGTGLGGYELTTRTVTPEETLLLFTDGLVERRGEDIDVSLARLAGLRLPPGTGVQQTLDQVLLALDAGHAEDDVAALAARIRPRADREATGAGPAA
ncbi:PP2C family protein-serine/threonine phosphatase [Streptomyces sp. NPDC090445]|uniref:PP2C family protein-serine/threonine phosphatase n=1 Tax=Streptomyces sp. NPDC090445 TaxID=3365963 RepID=UPI0037F4E6C3